MSTYKISELKEEFPDGIFFDFRNKFGYNDNYKAINFVITLYNNWSFKKFSNNGTLIDELIVKIIFAYQICIGNSTSNKVNENFLFLHKLLDSIFEKLIEIKSEHSSKEIFFSKYPQLKQYYEGKYYERK